jgi:CheY-like chemotaxis protein
MPTNVLVFESDPAFAGELRNELESLGCTTIVVDDGNAGLQQAASERPDLILLSIELPRMNGFSVCNKLKKDPGLKDVPLIIMSTESSDETFDQHKKLRTRAEDYVHKPIAFGELLEHIRRLVPLAAPQADSEGAIVIEDEIEVGSSDYLLEEDGGMMSDAMALAPPLSSARPAPREVPPLASPPRTGSVEDEVDAFAESAFDRLTGFDAPPGRESRPPPNGAAGSEPLVLHQRRTSVPPPAARASVRPSLHPAHGVDPLEHERLRAELSSVRERIDAAEGELEEARREIEKLSIEASDAARLARDADELRAKLAAATKTGGTSSRDFLDLREALNRKDKEILAFREQLSRKDREIVESQDRVLTLDRGRADVEERLLGLERELAEAREHAEALAEERDQAKRTSDELRTRLERAKGENEARERQLSELRSRQADERAASEVRFASVRAELDQVLANERAEHARALDQAELRRRTDMDQLRRERDSALTEAREVAERERREALSLQLSDLRQDLDSKLAASQRLHLQELERARVEAAQHEQSAIEILRAAQAEEVRALGEARDARIGSLEEHAARAMNEARAHVARLEHELGEARDEVDRLADLRKIEEAERGARIAELERRATEAENAREATLGTLASSADHVRRLEGQVAVLSRDLAGTRDALVGESARLAQASAKWQADRQSLERAKDALAIVLAQIEEAEARA